MTYDSMRLRPRCLPGIDNGDMLKQSVCQQCILIHLSAVLLLTVLSNTVFEVMIVWALVLFTAVNFLVAYEEKAPIMLYDWKIPLFLSNILFLVCLFVK